MVGIASNAFGQYWLADVTRLALCTVSMFLVLLCVRVAWLRARSPKGHPLRERSPWAVLSYGLFAFIPTVLGFRKFGQPLDPLLTPIFAAALFCGVFAAFGQVTIRLWTRSPSEPETDKEDGPGDELH
jgi:hypothetical protein